jgi:oligopeptide/dipeptide ABC transporter ATP-binding protein
MGEALLSVQHLTTAFHTEHGLLHAVDDVSFAVGPGETVAVVGESGCGKSVTALSILRLVPSPPGEILGGAVLLGAQDLLRIPEREMRATRGAKIAMIFQEPMTSLNPVYSVGSQIAEAVRIHQPVTRREAREQAIQMLGMVGIPSPKERVDAYPHQLSGGMRQRVMIAMALSCRPALLIADEPTTALDVTIQAQILDLLRELQQKLGMSMLFITHDLGLVAELAKEVVVMYAGQVVESGPVLALFNQPLHPYTHGLLGCIPALDLSRAHRPRRLRAIEGMVPDFGELGTGCHFATRCSLRVKQPPGYQRCTAEQPELRPVLPGRAARCHFAETCA